jgi:dTDP-glucose pyrophosphorylase
MRGLTQERPKAMLPVLGRPIIARVVDQLAVAGIKRTVIVVAADDQHIQPYFATHSPANMALTFTVQSTPRGMAHALLEATPHIDDAFILTACDSLYPDEHYRHLAEMHQTGSSPATLTLLAATPEAIRRASSVELIDGRVIRIVEKPAPGEAPSNIASLALYAFDRSLIDYLGQVQESHRGELELQDAIQMLIANSGGLAGLTTAWRWELTTPADLLEINLKMLAAQPDLNHRPATVKAVPPIFVEDDLSLPSDLQLGPNVYLESGAQIGAGATLRNCVVLRDGLVEAGTTIESQLISRSIAAA